MKSSILSSSKIVVYQFGKRHNYLIPNIFYKANKLSYLVTSTHSKSLRFLNCLRKNSKFATRKIPFQDDYIKSFPGWDVFKLVISPFYNVLFYKFHSFLRDVFLWLIVRFTLPSRGVSVYCMQDELSSSVKLFKSNSNPVILDIYLHPLSHHYTAYAKIFRNLSLNEIYRDYKLSRLIHACNYSTRILCPSQYVYDGIIKVSPESKSKTYICEYGYSGTPISVHEEKPNINNELLVSWIGRDPFRKGLDLFLSLSNENYTTKKKILFNVAGIPYQDVSNKYPNVKFHGELPYQQTMNLFQKSHIFILPSLSEGFASVIVEALMQGCLVVASESCGIMPCSDLPGLLVLRQPNQFVESLNQLLSLSQDQFSNYSNLNRNFAFNYYSEHAWSERLLNSSLF